MLVPKEERLACKSEQLLLEEELASSDIFGSVQNGLLNNGAAVSEAFKNDDSNSSFAFVKPEFKEEEQKLRLENEKAAKEAEEAEDDLDDELRELTKEERYNKLMDLLNKSKFYSKFLHDKMTSEDEEAKQLKESKLAQRKSLQNGKKETPKSQGRVSARKRPREDNDDNALKTGRLFKGEPIPEEQPILLSGAIMRDYQLKGYLWMASLYENGINGILADEMGLGKTIQTIALFCHLIEMGVNGPFLVVAPLSTITNWVKEFKNFAPLIPTVLYHGDQRAREDLRKHLHDVHQIDNVFETGRTARPVYITSYEIAMNDRIHFRSTNWRYIVVDEGHRIKNMHCRLIRELKQYRAKNKLLLTGTPLQNNLDELWSLLNFLMSEIFDDLRVFKSWFDAKDIDESAETEQERIVRQEQQGNILSTLHQILTPFLLRRVKTDVDLKIPPKKEVLVYCPMTTKQRELYEATVNQTLQQLFQEKQDENSTVSLNATPDSNRPLRKASKFDYKSILALENMESDRNFSKYIEQVAQMQEDREKRLSSMSSAYSREMTLIQRTSVLNYSVKSRMMDLRKVTNHPYLIEYPLSEDGVFYRIDEELVEICGKMKVLDQMLSALIERDHKVLIFSQMTRMLDIIEDFCNLKSLKFSRLDGSMGFEDRQKNIDSFNEDQDVRVFLLSTRAGGLGINLTAADTCIIYDSDWNPQQDLQAQDRCHRIGQTKPVMIYRLVTANTIDEKIVERAAAKRKLEKMIIHAKKFKSQDSEGLKKTMEAISPQELLELLNSKDHLGVVDRKDGPVFKKEELDLLLDRSDLTWASQKKMMEAKDLEEGNRKKKMKMDAAKGTVVKNANSIFRVIDTEGVANSLPSMKGDC